MTIDFELPLDGNTHHSIDAPADLSKSLDNCACCDKITKKTKPQIQKQIINSPSKLPKLTPKLTPKLKSKSKPKPILKQSSLKSESNPLTISRKSKINRGELLTVSFDENVVIYEVPYWNPCGELFPDYFSSVNEYDNDTTESVSKSVNNDKTESVTKTVDIHLKQSNSEKHFFGKLFNKKSNKKKKKCAKDASLICTVGVVMLIICFI